MHSPSLPFRCGHALRLLPLLCGLTGCGATSSGNAPIALVIYQTTPVETASLASLRTYECIPSALRAELYFQNGSSGDFTARVKWSSSDTGTVEVSNGDIEVGSTSSYYAAGTLVPVKSGSAIVTADYNGIATQISISVGTPQSITVKTLLEGDYIVPSSNSFSLGVGTTQALEVTAWLDGQETDLNDYATWSLQAANDSEATISSSTGTISAVGAGSQSLVPVASFAPCSLTSLSDTSTPLGFTVQQIESIALSTEFSGNPDLIVGNTEKMKVLATLANGDSQDISTQATLSSSDSDVAYLGSGSNNYLLTAEAAGGTIIGASYDGGGTSFTAPSLAVTAVTATLQTVSICWTAVQASFSGCSSSESTPTATAGSLTPIQFHAVGTYDAGTVTQEITRQTTWSSSDTSIATIGSTGEALGLLTQGASTITGTDSAAADVTSASLQLLVE
jgi:hypothetical protein